MYEIFQYQFFQGTELFKILFIVRTFQLSFFFVSCDPSSPSCYWFHTAGLTDILYIQDYDSEEKFSIPDERISHLLPTSYQDMIVRVYSKKPELVCK